MKLNMVTNKCFMNKVINQEFDKFLFKSRVNNTYINPNFEINEFRYTNLALNNF